MNHVMTEGVLGTAFAALLATLLPFHGAQAQPAPSCPVKIGGILPLTGSMGPVAKHIAESAQLAINHVNQGGGVKDCQVQFILRDDQGQSTVGVDAAKYLIEVEGVKSLTGTVSSGVSLPILTAAAVPSKTTANALRVLELLDRSDIHDAGAGRQDRRLFLPHAANCKDPGLCQRQGGRRARL